ncbi:MAG: hypothetical protein AB1486_07395 [Planctomycetota bacterium]
MIPNGVRMVWVRATGPLAVALLVTLGCSGGGGGGGGGDSGSVLRLEDVFYGRGLQEGTGFRIVSPLTTVESDPITGLVVPGTLRVLGAGVNLNNLVTFGLGPVFLPVVVPRNAVIVLRFTRALDPASVEADEFDADGALVRAGTIRIRDQQGNGVPVDLRVSGREVTIDPVVPGRVGLPPSPLVFDADGKPVADPTGYLRLVLPVAGGRVVRSASGERLGSRRDGLGDPQSPIGFNPGNAELDFISSKNLFPSTRTFNGFLPDVNAPRIVREFGVSGTFTPSAGDSVSSNSMTLHDAVFDTAANGGLGEWANRLLMLREGMASREEHAVVSNTVNTIVLADGFARPPQEGEAWKLLRAEFFEPDPTDPISPELFDPDNPQNPNNTKIKSFIWFEEIDAAGEFADANGDGKTRYTVDEKVPSRSVLKIRFNEPMDESSFLPYESFRVTELPEPEESGFEFVGLIMAEEGGVVMTSWPARENQLDPTLTEYMGFGPEPEASRLFTIRTVPDTAYLEERLSASELAQFVKRGYRGVTDLGGLGLAFPDSAFRKSQVFIEYGTSFSFETIPGQLYSATGALVHRFQGAPQTASDLFTDEPGVEFYDLDQEWAHVRGLYGPVLADINLRVNGVLAPAAVGFFTRILDDQPGNRPPSGQFDPWPQGVGAPIGGTTQGGITYASIYGVRFQHVYRVEDCSVSPYGDLAGSLFDLYRVAFAPIGGNVTTDVYEDLSVHAAHSQIVPDTTVSLGNPNNQRSGLGPAYDTITWADLSDPCNFLPPQPNFPNYIDPLDLVVPPGTSWTIHQSKLFSFPGTPHAYHPWPDFETTFKYNNRNSMVLEYRIRPQETAISYRNGFTFSPAILSSPLPRFRVYSFGDNNNVLQPDPVFPNGDVRARCATGPQPKPQRFGDNSRYFYTFEYVKTTSTIRSPFVQVRKTTEPIYLTPILSPLPDQFPPGTTVKFEFRAAEDPVTYRDAPDQGWTTDLSSLATLDFLQFRVQVIGNVATLLLPTFDSVVIPYHR